MHLLQCVLIIGFMVLAGWAYPRINGFFNNQARIWVERVFGIGNCSWYGRSVGRYGAKFMLAICFVILVVCSVEIERYFSTEKTMEKQAELQAIEYRRQMVRHLDEKNRKQIMDQASAYGRQSAHQQIMATRALCAPKWLNNELGSIDAIPPEVRSIVMGWRKESAARGLEDARIRAQEYEWDAQYRKEQDEIFKDKLYQSVPREDRHAAEAFGLAPVNPRSTTGYGIGGDSTLYRDRSGNLYKVDKGTVRKYDKGGDLGPVLNR